MNTKARAGWLLFALVAATAWIDDPTVRWIVVGAVAIALAMKA
jgi:hypothetical protein